MTLINYKELRKISPEKTLQNVQVHTESRKKPRNSYEHVVLLEIILGLLEFSHEITRQPIIAYLKFTDVR